MAIEYSIKPVNPAGHLYQVRCTVPSPVPEGQCFTMPAWIPGSYMIRDFARNVIEFFAENETGPVAWQKLDKSTWQCEPCEGPLTITYTVYAWDLSVRSAHLDQTHGYFNGTSVFMAANGHEDQPQKVEILPPEGDTYRHWRVATAMREAEGTPRYGFGWYECDHYDELIDHPVEIGNFTLATFEACGVPHDVVLSGKHQADMERLCRDLKVICEYHIRFFGEPAPMDRYVFMTLVVGNGYGGLEHRASTSLICSREDLPGKHLKGDEVPAGYRTYLGLCSHEYFHTWNVKRIKPAVFLPYQLHEETYTEQLWAFEGITSYYDDLSLVRCGLIKVESYLELLAQTATRVWRGQGRFKQSVTESSFDAWTRFYKQDENAPNAIVSYYTKGALVALWLDYQIRTRTDGRFSLDDVMRHLWLEFGQKMRGLDEQQIVAEAESLCGIELADWMAEALYGTDDVPLENILKAYGVEVTFRARNGNSDSGGESQSAPLPVTLGIQFASARDGVSVSVVYEDGPAMKAGISAQDCLVALDGIRLSADNLEKRLSRYEPGDVVEIHAFRRDELMVFSVILEAPPRDTLALAVAPEGLTELGRQWLGIPD